MPRDHGSNLLFKFHSFLLSVYFVLYYLFAINCAVFVTKHARVNTLHTQSAAVINMFISVHVYLHFFETSNATAEARAHVRTYRNRWIYVHRQLHVA